MAKDYPTWGEIKGCDGFVAKIVKRCIHELAYVENYCDYPISNRELDVYNKIISGL